MRNLFNLIPSLIVVLVISCLYSTVVQCDTSMNIGMQCNSNCYEFVFNISICQKYCNPCTGDCDQYYLLALTEDGDDYYIRTFSDNSCSDETSNNLLYCYSCDQAQKNSTPFYLLECSPGTFVLVSLFIICGLLIVAVIVVLVAMVVYFLRLRKKQNNTEIHNSLNDEGDEQQPANQNQQLLTQNYSSY